METSRQSRSNDIVPLKVLHLLQWPKEGRLHARVMLVLSILFMGTTEVFAMVQFFFTLTIERATLILTITEELVCAVYLVARSHDFCSTLSRFQETLVLPDHLSHLSRLMVAECERKATVFLKAWALAGVVINAFYLQKQLIDLVYASDVQVSNDTLLLTSLLGQWLHVEVDPIAVHFTLQFTTFTGFLTSGFYYIVNDCVFVALSLHICCQFDILKISLRSIALESSKPACSWGQLAAREEAVANNNTNLMPEYDEQETSRVNQLVQCIKHHQDILRVFADINQLLSPMIFVMVVNNLFKMTIVTIDMVLTPVSDLNFGGILMLQICTMVHVIMYCWGSAEIMTESEMVLDAAYECGWAEASGHFKQLLRVLMIRTSRPASFTIGSYGPITLQTFLGMTNFAYSVYAVLRQTYN